MSTLPKKSQPSSRQRKTASGKEANGKSRQRSIGSVPPPTEKQLQRMVLDYWRGAGLPGTRVAAIPNAGALGQSGLTRGLPDLMAYCPTFSGRMLFIELKTTKGRLSEMQEIIHAELSACGHAVVVCRSFEEASRVLVNWRICKPLAHLDRRA